MPNLTFHEAVRQSREFLDWSFSPVGRTRTDLDLWRYGLSKDVGVLTDRDARIEVAIECVERGGAIPSELREFVVDALQGSLPRRQGGKCMPRDAAICQAVFRLVIDGFNATRTKAKGPAACAEGGSACDAVGVALNMGYSNVERIWNAPSPHNRTRKAVLAVLEKK